MNRTFLLIVLIILFSHGYTQSYEWITGQDINYDFNPAMIDYNVATGPGGQVWFAGIGEFIEFYEEAMGSLFLQEYDPDADLLHDYTIDGSALITDMECDSDGSIYLAGQFRSDLVFQDGYVLPYAGPNINSYLAKISPEGQTQWAKNIDLDYPNSVAEDILVHGNRLLLAHSEWLESNITEYDLDGNFVSNINQEDVNTVTSLAMDSGGNLYATGSCPQNIGQYGGVPYPTPFPYSIYLVKYDPEGMPQWVNFTEDVTCTQPRIIIDQEDDIIWAGTLYIETAFDTITLQGPVWVFDLYLTKFNPQGHVLWGVEVPQVTTGDASVAKFKTLAILPDNSVTLFGFTRGIIDWGNGVVSNAIGLSNDLMTLTVSPEGTPTWVKTGGGEGYESSLAMAHDGEGSLYLAGIGHGTITFDSLTYTGESYYYPFLVKLNTDQATSIPAPAGTSAQNVVYPNPAGDYFKVSLDRSRIDKVDVFNAVGSLEDTFYKTDQCDISGFPAGMYLVRITTSDDEVFFNRLIKSR